MIDHHIKIKNSFQRPIFWKLKSRTLFRLSTQTQTRSLRVKTAVHTHDSAISVFENNRKTPKTIFFWKLADSTFYSLQDVLNTI
jgi:hypothetical protein